MSPDSLARMRQALSAGGVDALDLPGAIAGDRPRTDKYRLQSERSRAAP